MSFTLSFNFIMMSKVAFLLPSIVFLFLLFFLDFFLQLFFLFLSRTNSFFCVFFQIIYALPLFTQSLTKSNVKTYFTWVNFNWESVACLPIGKKVREKKIGLRLLTKRSHRLDLKMFQWNIFNNFACKCQSS